MQLIYFLFGVLFMTIALPIVDSVVGCACARFERYKLNNSKEMTKINVEIEKLQYELQQDDCNCSSANVIGFQLPEEEEIEDEI